MRRIQHKLQAFMLSTLVLILLGAVTLTAFRLHPELVPLAVDSVRGILGPDVVAWIEDVAFQTQDQVNQAKYRLGGRPPELVTLPTPEPDAQSDAVTLAQEGVVPVLPPVDLGVAPAPATRPLQSNSQPSAIPELPRVDLSGAGSDPAELAAQGARPTLRRNEATIAGPGSANTGSSTLPSHGPTAVLTPVPPDPEPSQSLPLAGVWQPIAHTASNGVPVLSETLLRPDPGRPYAEAIVVSIDLRHASLKLVAGTKEPASPVKAPRPGVIPAADAHAGRLLAAFNGGFKAVNGGFGIAVNGVTLIPPRAGLATLGIYRDGSLRIGAWGNTFTPSPDLETWRQNCPPLIQGGRLNDQVNANGMEWGRTIKNEVITWRSGLGLSADHNTLYYAVGDNLSASTLARALLSAGASDAMQLDINSFWVRFITYDTDQNGGLIGSKLVPSMAGDLRTFLTPDTRDFFYLVAK